MMLLDTHTLMWALTDDDRLSERAKHAICTQPSCISVVTLWELAIKASLQRRERRLNIIWTIPELETICNDHNIDILNISSGDCEYVRTLPHIHEDPFDRILIAQAFMRNMPIVTKDENIWKYDGIVKIW